MISSHVVQKLNLLKYVLGILVELSYNIEIVDF